jgi:ParB-like chromosome segregation protein Spo0J
MDRVVWRPIGELKEFPGNPRRHPESQIAGLMKSIRRFWTNPILVDEIGTILAGHGRWEAASRLGMTEVPTVTVSGLSDSEKRAVVIADNRLPERAVWDFDLLRVHFQDLIKVDFDVELTGFSTGEIDLLIDSSQPSMAASSAISLAS